MSNEWYTQPQYIKAAREVMYSIELDPASCPAANEIIKAERIFIQEQNGLAQDWKARSLWLNPPYARTANYHSGIRAWTEKAVESYQSGDVQEAILLLTTEVNAQWFQPLWQYPICFANHRVKFIAPKKDKRGVYSHMFGACFVYLGSNEQRFSAVFSQFGHVVRVIASPCQPIINLQMWKDGDVA